MSNTSGEPTTVRYHPHFIEQIEPWRAKAEKKPQSAEAIMYRAVQKIAEEVLVGHAHDPRWVLTHLPVRRVQSGRLRVFFAFSPEKRIAILLMIGIRAQGDRRDAYDDIERELKRGVFDEVLDELGIAR